MTTTTSPTLIWNDLGQQLSCTPVRLTWNYAGSDEALDLSLTNVDVTQSPPPVVSSVGGAATTSATISNTFTNSFVTFGRRQATASAPSPTASSSAAQLQFIIASQVSAQASSYDYPSIAAPQGWYQFIAASSSLGDISKRSQSFWIWNGTDTSCIPPPTPPSSSTTQAGGGGSTTGGGATSSPSSTGSPANSSGGSSGSSNNAGKIAGGVIGGLAGLALLGLLFWLLSRRSRQKHAPLDDDGIPGAPTHRKGTGKWGGLSSVDSIAAAAAVTTSERKPSTGARSPHGGSKSKGFLGALALNDRGVKQHNPAGSSTAATTPYAEELDDPEKASPFDGGPYSFTPDGMGYHSPAYSSTPTGSRRPSAAPHHTPSSSMSGIMGRDQPMSGSPPTSPPASSLGHASPMTLANPPNFGAIDDQLAYDPNSQQQQQSSETPKKPTRKPVPSYTPSTVSGLGFSPNPNHESFQPPPAMPAPYASNSGSSSPGGHYAVQQKPGLNHKNSFGKDGQIHYLMPDMPASHS